MSTWSALLVVFAVAAVTYAMRACVVVALAGRAIPHVVERSLRNVGPAVLSALALNLAAGGEGGPSLSVPEAAALCVAGIAGWWRKSVIWSLGSGMTTLWVLSAAL